MKPCNYCGRTIDICLCGLHDDFPSKPEPRTGFFEAVDAEWDEVPPSSMPMLLGDLRSIEGDEAALRRSK